MSERSDRSLSTHYLGWVRDGASSLEPALRSGLVVLDTNVLLSLYEVGVTARAEVTAVLEQIAEQLWIPNQVAIEFSRNRHRVVVDRVSQFKRVRRMVKGSIRDAVAVLESAVEQVEALRVKTRTARDWEPDTLQLGRAAFEERLSGATDRLVEELEALEAEHDVEPGGMSGGDVVFERLDALLRGRIGEPVDSSNLRHLVSEAVDFRYPNQIPPGYSDTQKATKVGAAGDYIMWWEVLREARSREDTLDVLVVTSDAKPDWWELSGTNKPIRPRPELVQEMQDFSKKRLVMATLSDFLSSASEILSAQVSRETLAEVREVEINLPLAIAADIAAQADAYVDLLNLHPIELENLVASLLRAMGMSAVQTMVTDDSGVDILVFNNEGSSTELMVVEVKRFRSLIGAGVVRAVLGAMVSVGAQRAMIVVTSSFSNAATALALRHGIRLIDGQDLVRLLQQYLNISASIGPRRLDGDTDADIKE